MKRDRKTRLHGGQHASAPERRRSSLQCVDDLASRLRAVEFALYSPASDERARHHCVSVRVADAYGALAELRRALESERAETREATRELVAAAREAGELVEVERDRRIAAEDQLSDARRRLERARQLWRDGVAPRGGRPWE